MRDTMTVMRDGTLVEESLPRYSVEEAFALYRKALRESLLAWKQTGVSDNALSYTRQKALIELNRAIERELEGN